MAKKLIVIIALTSAVFVWMVVSFFDPREIFSISSPDGRYTVRIIQERPLPPLKRDIYLAACCDAESAAFLALGVIMRVMVERYVYLNAYHDGQPFLIRKLLYTGDLLDNEFLELYPRYSWLSDSILKIDEADIPQSDSLHIANETSRQLKYLLVETGRDKFVLFNVAPGAVVDLPFLYYGRLSCQGEFYEPATRFGDAVELEESEVRAVVQKRFMISVKDDGVSIGSPHLQLDHVTCCTYDRPDFYHE